ncbi:MAG: glutamate formimidoyltransferase [Ignavibacteria bacterium]|nr:glutamate formimidoyltransferase [Ignavibacteria bacterium]MBI3764927.1 glutamate formimidoyltransferase [Ignavibacteriales bacterium]
MKIVECVPNFSEGRDMKIINAIGDSIRNVKGVKLLSVEPDKDYNRSVVTFIGEPEAVKDGAFQATKMAAELIDMSRHKGEHPRMGATDVVPFVPVSGVSMEECVRLANDYGKRVADELHIPIYLYEEAARTPERQNLATIRKGEYEGLVEKLKDPAWKPDFGAAVFNAKSGATVTGARVFLIAYNVNLTTNNKDIAHEIALRIRESGRTVKDGTGKSVKIPGSLKAVRAMGVLLERFNIAQVSINLINFNITPPHIAFEEVTKQAQKLGVNVSGSEIVGLIPKEAMLMAGKFYADVKHHKLNEDQLIARAIQALGLSQFEQFVPEKKIIEYML